MGADPFEIIALSHKVGLESCLVDERRDVGCDNMKTGADETQGGCVGTSLDGNAVDATGQGLDGTKPTRTGSVVDGGATLPIFLVVHPQGDGVSMEQDIQGARGG
jgi:hypothetical protein